MAIELFDLAAADGRRFSPECRRVRMALGRKSLAHTTVPTGFTGIAALHEGRFRTLPVLRDGEQWVGDSMRIAEYLDAAYPDQPSIFPDGGSRLLARFVDQWLASVVQPLLVPLIAIDIWRALTPADQVHFRTAREVVLKKTLEAAAEARDEKAPSVRQAFDPLRGLLRQQPFIGGDVAAFADFIPYGLLAGMQLVSAYRPFDRDDPVASWFARCAELPGGTGND